MKGIRILRYIGNRQQPERDVLDSLEHYLQMSASPFLLLGETELELLKRLGEDKVPDVMFSDFRAGSGPGELLWLPTREENNSFSQYFNSMPPPPVPPTVHVRKKEIKQDEFEVNLVEPLVGWRGWWADEYGMLRSLNESEFVWPVLKRAEASCAHGKKHVPPVEKCSCGFYAVDTRNKLRENGYSGQQGMVCGTVYGWGRYVRGEHGFRCQYAYPKCLFLDDSSAASMVNKLKHYRVPIFYDVPLPMYSPEGEGYANEYWEDEAHGDSGAGERSGAPQGRSPDEDRCPF